MKRIFFTFLIFFAQTIWVNSLFGEVHGKVDLGPTIMDIDILESGKTKETLHMKGIKGDATILVYQGLCIKPGFLWGRGHGQLAAGCIAVGYYFPFFKCFRILPHVGMSWSYLYTRIDLKELGQYNLRERFKSYSPYIGLEICYTFAEKWTITAIYQYGWSRTHTKIGSIVSSKGHSTGPNYSLGIEYWFDQHWALNFGVGYNVTLSNEKHGIRGKGAKLGVAYYF